MDISEAVHGDSMTFHKTGHKDPLSGRELRARQPNLDPAQNRTIHFALRRTAIEKQVDRLGAVLNELRRARRRIVKVWSSPGYYDPDGPKARP